MSNRNERLFPRVKTPAGQLTELCYDLSRMPILTQEQERRLALVLRDPERSAKMRAKARDLLVRCNLRLAFLIAKRYQGRGLDLPDLVQEGTFGLLRAVRDFDPDRARFSTYATWWIRQYIIKGVENHGRTIRVPNYQRRIASLWEKAARKHADGAVDESAMSAEVADQAQRQYQHPNAATVLAGVRVLRAGVESLNNYEADGGPNVPLSHEPSPFEELERRELVQLALESLGQLSAREIKVLRLRLGLDGGEPLTLARIGRLLRITRERVRQIEMQALATLRESLSALAD